jgi:hypothetical protein
MRQLIEEAWRSLHQCYAKVLGFQNGDNLTAMIDNASNKPNNIHKVKKMET